MKTIMPKQIDNSARNWYVVDAKDKTLGRLATEVAIRLKGKHKADYAAHIDNGDYVIILNADKFHVTGKKMSDKMYYSHSGFLGGLKAISLEKLLNKKPTEPLKKAVAGMLPKNKLRKGMLDRLKLYTGESHNHAAQNPETITL
ncbi:MAG: 50S ribosomal protein L13 [Candidatus Gracilibacteria bacterium]|jgi:large subunit ribosomal protein L13|nr:50S ribosomal protein L13 [Candidatus Gracilibacteria bacterium]